MPKNFQVRWEPPQQEFRNGLITGYKIRYRKSKSQVQVETTPSNQHELELLNLEKMSPYQIKIAAFNVNGRFLKSSSIQTIKKSRYYL
jgi:neogenin